ncbi:hypothetical protein BXU11_00630 [Flavobacterium sp. LM5]|nr:hypothetical protein BXU11_00630 [Flavobacterium sp. LM5]
MFLEKTSTDSVNYDKNGKIARKPTNIFKKKAKNNKELDPPSPQYEKGKVYDKNGNVIEYNSIDSYGNLGYVVKYKYNNLNYEIESISYNSNGNLIEKWDSKYELDKYQNWTKRMIYVNENFKYIIERKIKYY